MRTLPSLWLALLLACLLLFPQIVLAQDYEPTISILPLQPTPDDPITITVSGEWMTPCTPLYVSHDIADGQIVILTRTQIEGLCPIRSTPWSFDVEIPSLAQGVYDVFVTGIVNGELRFAVLEPETLVNHSYLPAVAR
jgi:hypothetical protein